MAAPEGPARGLDQAIAEVAGELLAATASTAAVVQRCAAVSLALERESDPERRASALARLAEMVSRRAGEPAVALFDFVAAELAKLSQPSPVLDGLLAAADDDLRRRALRLAAALAREGRVVVTTTLLERVARIDEATPLPEPGLDALRELVQQLAPGQLPEQQVEGPEQALVRHAATRGLRRLGARLLDASGSQPELELVARRIGREQAAFLLPYLDHSRAGWQDLVLVTPEPDRDPPFLEGLRQASRTLGPALLREVVGQLGWSRLACGVSAEPRVGLSVGGSFPLLVSPAQARLVASAAASEVLWRRHLVIAHGGQLDGGGAPTSDEMVRRFRGYNVTHAELLDEILAVAPLDEAKLRRILLLMDRVVADFAALFGSASEDARRVGEAYQRLRRLAAPDLERAAARGPLSGETVRRVQMFEDPQRLDDVTTLHGLKRYLHQKGLSLAFGLFRSHQGADHTVDLLVTGERELLRSEQAIRYLEFEPTPPVGPARLPFLVATLAEALGRQLLHGRKLPRVTVLGFGNELQLHVYYRNHPAFVRIDLSPPRRGGMIDLEYFAVSQYEMDQHPDLSLQAIQRVLRELDFDVSKEGLRLSARYDKERAVDLADIVGKARALFELLPYLMDVDWVIGDLDYPEQDRPKVAAAWAAFFTRWGAVPAEEVLSASRRKIVAGFEPDPAGRRELLWDGRGAYRDRFSGTPPDALEERLRAELERCGLGPLLPAAPATAVAVGQRLLEQTVLEPLADAVRRGEARETPSGIERVPEELFQREHEAVRLATVLAQGGPALERAARLAALVRGIEQQLRFRTTGSIQGFAVQAASLATAPHAVGLFVLRDAQGIARLALAAAGGVLYRSRAGSDAPWRNGDELDAPDLARLLRGYNYLSAGASSEPALGPAELAAVRGRFAAPHPSPVARQATGERFVPATVAAPGRATGFVGFHTTGTEAVDLDGTVLVAPVIRPQDAPWLRRAAGIVSTGGGILSHVGLIALELQKPAAIVEGRWATSTSGAQRLLLRRPLWRELEATLGGMEVVCRLEQRDAEEPIEPGDLVCVDGEREGLVVLGHDPQALMLHRGLRLLEAAATSLAATQSDAEILACRGRLFRALHQLERLLARLEQPALVRHAVRELVSCPPLPQAPEGRQGQRRLLATLLDNPAGAEEARASVARRLQELRARLAASSRAAHDDLPHLRHPAEVLFTRLGVRRMQDALSDALELSLTAETGDGAAEAALDLDAACRRRLEEMRSALAARADAGDAVAGERWRLRHLLPRLEQLEHLLDGPAAGSPWTERAEAFRRQDAARIRGLGAHRILRGADGGVELRPLAGGKAAQLGEIERILGEPAVPSWFVVADTALREVLRASVPAAALEALGLGAARSSLAEAIADVTARRGWDARRQASAIRGLWQAMPLPPELAAEVTAAYRALAERPGEDAAVALRSSSREEDAETSAWAGQFDTFLYVRGEGAVLEHLRFAWAGFWTERAIDQRRLLGAQPLVGGGGIVIQRMVNARVSGVLHTVCAATGQLREMVVNAGLGLGEGVVSGTVDVDHILVSKDQGPEAGQLQLRYRVGDKRQRVVCDEERGSGTRREETRYHQRLRAALEYVELEELVRAAARLEDAFGFPLDIEFAIEGQELRLLQARSIPLFDAAWGQRLACFPSRSERPAVEKEAS